MVDNKNIDKERKSTLLKIIGEVVKEKRSALKKGILLLSYEYDISNTSIAQLEKGKRDVQVTTLWKISQAFNLPFSEFIKEVEKRLPEDFKIVD